MKERSLQRNALFIYSLSWNKSVRIFLKGLRAPEAALLAAVYYDLGFLKIQKDKHEEALEYFGLSFKTDDIEKMRLLCTCNAYTSQLGQLIR